MLASWRRACERFSRTVTRVFSRVEHRVVAFTARAHRLAQATLGGRGKQRLRPPARGEETHLPVGASFVPCCWATQLAEPESTGGREATAPSQLLPWAPTLPSVRFLRTPPRLMARVSSALRAVALALLLASVWPEQTHPHSAPLQPSGGDLASILSSAPAGRARAEHDLQSAGARRRLLACGTGCLGPIYNSATAIGGNSSLDVYVQYAFPCAAYAGPATGACHSCQRSVCTSHCPPQATPWPTASACSSAATTET